MAAVIGNEMIEIRTLEGVSIKAIYAAMISAFSDYAETFDKSLPEFECMLSRRGFSPGISFGAYHNNELVSFILNGNGYWQGQPTAYDTGTGTIKAFRQQGLASRVLNEAVAMLQKHGTKQYLLEAIRINTKAIDLYKKAGFETVRELDYYIAPKEKINITKKLPGGFGIKELKTPDWQAISAYHDFYPSWQNSADAIGRQPENFKTLGIYKGSVPAGYGIIEPATGDMPQLAIAGPYRRLGIGTCLFQALVQHSEAPVCKIINADTAYEPFKLFMQSMNIAPGHGQYEMMLKL